MLQDQDTFLFHVFVPFNTLRIRGRSLSTYTVGGSLGNADKCIQGEGVKFCVPEYQAGHRNAPRMHTGGRGSKMSQQLLTYMKKVP